MPRYRKKPVVIEAMQFDGSFKNYDSICDWSGVDFSANTEFGSKPDGEPDVVAELFIETLEGTHKAIIGDWIIMGVKGEFYPCKPDIFAQTYEYVEE